MFGLGVGIDLGTSSVMIYVEGRGIVLTEPSVIACNTRGGEMIAVGEPAYRMIGRNPESISVIRPLKDGVVSDFPMTEKMLQHYIQKICGNRIFKPHVIVCMPSSVTNLEKRTILDVATASGAGMACLIEEPLAAAIGAGIDIHHPYGTMIVDMGGGTTDIAVITMGSIAISGSVRIAGNEFDEAIMRYVKTYKNVTIGERTAEEIKKQIGCAYIREEEVAMIAKGKNYITGMPESFEISSTEVYEAICDLLDDLFEAVRSILEVTPPELVSDIATQGIILTGGGALLYGMDTMVQKRTGIRARVADDPLHCVVKGTGAALKDMNVLADNGYIFTSREELVGIKD